MEQNRLRELEDQCIQECPPPCITQCPLHVDVRQMLLAVQKGDFLSAFKVFRKTTPFPGIVSRTCSQPCRENCFRKSIGGSIQVSLIERACVEFGMEGLEKTTLLPRKNGRVAVIGGGMCGISAAFELSKKGYQVTLFEAAEHLGGRLWDFSEIDLPRDILLRETEQIMQTGVQVIFNQRTDPVSLQTEGFDAILVATGNAESNTDVINREKVDPVTFQTEKENIFATGSLLHTSSIIYSISDGKRAAISIDRFLQRVSLTASRANEGDYPSRLVKNISTIEISEVVKTDEILGAYSQSEAVEEAARCIQCDCMECVKVCEYLKQYGSYPRKYVREIYNNLSIIMRTRTSNKFINSCTLCGLCAEVCPTDLDMGKVNLETRQEMVSTSKMPVSAHDFALRDMSFSNSEKAAGIFFPDGKTTCKTLFFPGCQLTASNPEYITQIIQKIQSVYPETGVLLRCCGAPAEWSGETDLFKQSINDLQGIWEQAGKPRIVLACSSCSQVLEKYLPQAKRISLWELLVDHKLLPARKGELRQFVIHDPCTSRYNEKWQAAIRQALAVMGVPYHELKMSRNLTECCGYGGVAWLANPQLVKLMIQRRINEDQADYLTYCVMCRDLFAAEGKPALHLLDLVFGKESTVPSSRQVVDYSQRHENRIRAKKMVEKWFTGKDQVQLENYEKIKLVLTPEMRALIEARLILIEDVQKVIEHAESSGECFIDQSSGHSLAYFKPNLITYWVEYTKQGESFIVHDAYSHRMMFEGDASL